MRAELIGKFIVKMKRRLRKRQKNRVRRARKVFNKLSEDHRTYNAFFKNCEEAIEKNILSLFDKDSELSFKIRTSLPICIPRELGTIIIDYSSKKWASKLLHLHDTLALSHDGKAVKILAFWRPGHDHMMNQLCPFCTLPVHRGATKEEADSWQMSYGRVSPWNNEYWSLHKPCNRFLRLLDDIIYAIHVSHVLLVQDQHQNLARYNWKTKEYYHFIDYNDILVNSFTPPQDATYNLHEIYEKILVERYVSVYEEVYESLRSSRSYSILESVFRCIKPKKILLVIISFLSFALVK
jgi:hypothetical protein